MSDTHTLHYMACTAGARATGAFLLCIFFWDKNTRGYFFIFISFLLFIPYLLFISVGEEKKKKKLYLFDGRFVWGVIYCCTGGRAGGVSNKIFLRINRARVSDGTFFSFHFYFILFSCSRYS